MNAKQRKHQRGVFDRLFTGLPPADCGRLGTSKTPYHHVWAALGGAAESKAKHLAYGNARLSFEDALRIADYIEHQSHGLSRKRDRLTRDQALARMAELWAGRQRGLRGVQ